MNTLYQRFTTLADRKKNITDDDLLDLLHTSEGDWAGFQLESVEVKANGDGAHSTVTLARNDETTVGAASGNDPVTAICSAINAAADTSAHLESYRVNAHRGSGRVHVELAVRFADRSGSGRAEDSDMVHAAASAYLKAVNHYRRHCYQGAREEPVAGD